MQDVKGITNPLQVKAVDDEKNTPKFANGPLLGKRLHKDMTKEKKLPIEDNDSADLEVNFEEIFTREFLNRIEAAKARIEANKKLTCG